MICTKCGAEKPASDFHVDRSKSTGRRPDCKTCVKGRVRAFYQANAARLRPVKRQQMRDRRAVVVV